MNQIRGIVPEVRREGWASGVRNGQNTSVRSSRSSLAFSFQ